MSHPTLSERHEDALRLGCPLTVVSCTNHPAYGPELLALLGRLGLRHPPLCDLVAHPGGWYHALTPGLVHRKFLQALEDAIARHEPEVVVLAGHPACHDGARHPHEVERYARQAGDALRAHFPRLEVVPFVPRKPAPAPGNSVVVTCGDHRNFELSYRLATGAAGHVDPWGRPYALVAVPGDVEGFVPAHATAEEIAYLTRCVCDAVDPAQPGEVLVIAHLECGRRARTRCFTPQTPEPVQVSALLEGAAALAAQVGGCLPHHVLRTMLSRTVGRGSSTGLESLRPERPSLA
jgi:hypothetical protein